MKRNSIYTMGVSGLCTWMQNRISSRGAQRSRIDSTVTAHHREKSGSGPRSQQVASLARGQAGWCNGQSGFVMPTVIMLMAIMSIVAYAALMQSSNSLNLAYKQTYIQMARTASKAAIDYAQEQFDNAPCGAYTGTTEQTLVENSRYRVTFKVEVVSTSADGYEKVIKGTGSVYLPKLSATAQYVFDVRSEIVRTYAVCKSPDNFAPKVWLDASDETTLHTLGTSTTTASPTTSYGSAGDSTRDTLEERADNGTQTANSWQSDDFELHTCDSAEFSNAICSSNSTRYLYTGMIFSNVSVPQGSTITSATITLACTTPSGTAGSLNHRIYGLYESATDPHPSLFTQTGTGQIRNRLLTSSLHTTAFASTTSNNCPPGNNTVYDVTNVAQEVVNHANWTSGGRMGFSFQRQSGSGSRHLLKNGNQFNITYSTTTVSQADNGASVGQWDDISGNGNHARIAYGTAPTRQDNQINNETVVRFNNGTMLSSLTSAIANAREMTVFAVVKPNMATSSNDGRIISGMSSGSNNDTTAGTSIIPLLRNGSGDGFSSQYTSNSTTYRTNYSCGSACSGNAYLFASSFTIEDDNEILALLKGNGAPVASKPDLSPTGSPYTFGLNQFYYGGRRNTAAGADYFNGDFAEIVIYDRALECRQIEALEEYFRAKWAISATQWSTTCPAVVIPTL